MDDTQRIVKCGNLALHTPGGFFKKRWHSKYLVLYDGSKSGVKRLELFESEIKFKKQNPVKIIPLVDCVRIVTCQRHKSTFTFEVRTSDQFYLLASKSFQDMNDWVNCLRFVAFGQQQQQQSNGLQSNPNGQQQQVSADATLAARTSSGQKQTSESGGSSTSSGASSASSSGLLSATSASLAATTPAAQRRFNSSDANMVDVLLNRQQPTASSNNGESNRQQQQVSALSNGGLVSATSRLATAQSQQQAPNVHVTQTSGASEQKAAPPVMTASQAAAAAASALAKTRQRQPSLLGSCKPQPPNDSPFIQQQQQQQLDSRFQTPNSSEGRVNSFSMSSSCGGSGQMDTLTPTVRGQLIAAATTLANQNITGKPFAMSASNGVKPQPATFVSQSRPPLSSGKQLQISSTLDEEEENMLYCSIEDNPSEHNYRVKVIETELALRCQLKCYQLTAPTTISQQYEELAHFRSVSSSAINLEAAGSGANQPTMVTFYQLIIGPQELTLLNDYATSYASRTLNHNSKLPLQQQQQQGLWSWPYQCIRRYGFDKDNCFMFEAGRKCTSGPGQFIVQTPKAYNIYQDVVKFVNELRTISTTSQPMAMTQAQTNESLQQQHQQQPKQMIVTQIPVTWTPSNNNNQNQQDREQPIDVSSRRQFFDALRQLDHPKPTTATVTAASQGEQPVVANYQATNGCNDNNRASANRPAGGGADAGAQAASSNSIDAHHHHHPNHTQMEQPLTSTTNGHHPIGAKLTSHDHTTNEVLSNGINGLVCEQQSIGRAQPSQGILTKRSLANATSGSNSQQRQQLASISSSTSDETDESGYEQGDESVDSGPVVKQQQQTCLNGARTRQQAPSQSGSWRNAPRSTTATSRLASSSTEHSPDMSSASSPSSSSSSSASNSPGQSISRRTADLMGHSTSAPSNGNEQVKAAPNQRPRLPLPSELTNLKPATTTATNAATNSTLRTASQKVAPQTSNGLSQANLHNLLTASCLLDNNSSTNMAASKGRPSHLAKSASNIKLTTAEEDFETSLIRDVYSEITKLHAKFAVTTNGADDSISSGGESVMASSSSTSSDNNMGRNGDGDENNHEDDYDSMEAAHRNEQQTEPMYSNLKPPPLGDIARRGLTVATLDRLPSGNINNNNDGHHQANHQRAPITKQQAQQATNNHHQMHFNEHIRPPPLYPTMLNPIPEIVEHQPGPASTHKERNLDDRTDPKRNKLPLLSAITMNHNHINHNVNHLTSGYDCHRQQQQQRADGNKDQATRDELPRARLALDRDAIKKSLQSVGHQQRLSSAPAMAQNGKPTNHYLINDVQYAKISRNMAAAANGSRLAQGQDQLTGGQRRR